MVRHLLKIIYLLIYFGALCPNPFDQSPTSQVYSTSHMDKPCKDWLLMLRNIGYFMTNPSSSDNRNKNPIWRNVTVVMKIWNVFTLFSHVMSTRKHANREHVQTFLFWLAVKCKSCHFPSVLDIKSVLQQVSQSLRNTEWFIQCSLIINMKYGIFKCTFSIYRFKFQLPDRVQWLWTRCVWCQNYRMGPDHFFKKGESNFSFIVVAL